MTNRTTRDLSVQPAEPVEPIRFGRYLIHSLLNVGGMAEIYRASVTGPEGFDKPVVVKRVRSQYAGNEHFVQMFIDEAKICATLDHANLVSVFDFGESDGHYYLAMEFIDGLDLQSAHVRHRRRHGTPLRWQASVLVLRDALRGLDFAHRATGPDGRPLGIVHRDIDLANIMVRRDGAVKVLDFGCAKAAKSIRRTETVAGVIKGKLGYMSPEQAWDKPLDARSDIFSAGIVLHELLTGHRLFYGPDPVAVIQAVRSRPIPDPREFNPAVPEALAAIVMRGLERDREARYPSASEMADALEALVYEHRIPQSLLRETFEPLMDPPEIQARPTRSAEQRRLTMAAWTDSATEADLLVFTGELLADSTSGESAPSIDATVVTTNPRWMLPEELNRQTAATPLEARASGPTPEKAAPAPAPAFPASPPPQVPLAAQKTQIIQEALGAAQSRAAPPTTAPENAPAPRAGRAPQPTEVPVSEQKTLILEDADADADAPHHMPGSPGALPGPPASPAPAMPPPPVPSGASREAPIPLTRPKTSTAATPTQRRRLSLLLLAGAGAAGAVAALYFLLAR